MESHDRKIKKRRRREPPALYEMGAACAFVWLIWQLLHSL
jgi:hypothetical protein